MFNKFLTAALLLAGAGWAVADEKDGKYAKPGAGGPPPGKGYRKNESPAPAPKGPAAKKPQAKAPARTDDGIGRQVSAWARSGVHGPQLAARIHQLQASKAKTQAAPSAKPPKPGKFEPTPAPKNAKNPKKKGKGGGEEG